MPDNHYDLIIIGGRCAGSSLAIRLAGSGLKILLVDRTTFPSLPNVSSGPFIHPGTMRLMDDLGIDESEYTHPGSRIERFVVDFGDNVHVVIPTSVMNLDRNYLRGIDRTFFDTALWKRASQVQEVTARERFSVTRILKDDQGMVTGIVGRNGDTDERFTADLIVGADGRFSFTAKQFGARIIEEKNDHMSAVYLAEWENVEDYSPELPNAITTYNTGEGLMILVIPVAERKYHVGIAMRSKDANFGAKGFEQAYHNTLRGFPNLMNRLKNATCVDDHVVGMRAIKNGYRDAFGPGWVLVGDALHYKDPADGQGIYDALLGTKLLAQAILDWKHNGATWVDAGARYEQQFKAATYPVFLQTVDNIKQTLYLNAPGFIFKRMGRWLMSDEDFQTQFLRYMCRAEEKGPSLSPKTLVNGLVKDIRNLFRAS